MKYPPRTVMTFKNPLIKKAENRYGCKFKETFALVMEEDTMLPAVHITRTTEYPTKECADKANERFVREFNGKFYYIQEYGIRLPHFYDAFEYLSDYMNTLHELAKKELSEKNELVNALNKNAELDREDRKIIINQIRTPDGTVLISRHRHDYVTYTDKNGLEYMVDGGTDYLRRNVHKEAPYTEISIFEGDDVDFEYFRTVFCRGGRGKDGTEPLKWVPLAEMSNSWVEAVISYEEELRPNNPYLKFFRQEVVYRDENKIYIKD